MIWTCFFIGVGGCLLIWQNPSGNRGCVSGFSRSPRYISILGSVYNSAAGKLLKKQEQISHLPCLLNHIDCGRGGRRKAAGSTKRCGESVLRPRWCVECWIYRQELSFFREWTLAWISVDLSSIASAFGACLSTVRCEFAEKVDKKRRRQSRKTGVVKDGRRIIPAVPSTRLP